MKAFLWVVLLAIIAVSFYFIILVAKPDNSQQIALMFGNPADDEIELHVELTMSMADKDVDFRYITPEGAVDWKAWANDHYIVTDKAGNQVDFSKRGKSDLLPKKDEMRGYYDSFLIGKVKKGEAYTFKYVPVVGELDAFIYEFTAPTDDGGRSRVIFKPI